MLTDVQVEHELRQGAMQTGDRAAHQRETRAGELGRGLEVEPAVLFAKSDVVLDLEVELARDSPAAHLDVLLLTAADRHRLMR
ncbi:hypothetical protein D3C81_1793570 [compost metagenome]